MKLNIKLVCKTTEICETGAGVRSLQHPDASNYRTINRYNIRRLTIASWLQNQTLAPRADEMLLEVQLQTAAVTQLVYVRRTRLN